MKSRGTIRERIIRVLLNEPEGNLTKYRLAKNAEASATKSPEAKTGDRQMSRTNVNGLAAPCGLYCGACIDYLAYGNCHGCGCSCRECAASAHHKSCDIYRCCVEQKGLKTCSECNDLPCSKLIQFCYNPVWLHHLPAIENLRRQKAIGVRKWLKEQKEAWSNKWYLQRWIWFQKECEDRLERSLEESKTIFAKKKKRPPDSKAKQANQ